MSQLNPPCWVKIASNCSVPKELNVDAENVVGLHTERGIVHWIGEPKLPTRHAHWNDACLSLAERGPDGTD